MNAVARPKRVAAVESAFLIAAFLLLLFTPLFDPAVATTLAVTLLLAALVGWEVLRRGLKL